MKIEVTTGTHITKNFTFGELANNMSSDEVKAIYNDDIRLFATMLQELRDWYRKSIKCNSWYRTKSFNSLLKGASPNSLHLRGFAFDWGVVHTAQQHKNVEKKWREICEKYGIIGGINHYSGGYHLSIHEELFGNKEFITRDYRGTKKDW